MAQEVSRSCWVHRQEQSSLFPDPKVFWKWRFLLIQHIQQIMDGPVLSLVLKRQSGTDGRQNGAMATSAPLYTQVGTERRLWGRDTPPPQG